MSNFETMGNVSPKLEGEEKQKALELRIKILRDLDELGDGKDLKYDSNEYKEWQESYQEISKTAQEQNATFKENGWNMTEFEGEARTDMNNEGDAEKPDEKLTENNESQEALESTAADYKSLYDRYRQLQSQEKSFSKPNGLDELQKEAILNKIAEQMVENREERGSLFENISEKGVDMIKKILGNMPENGDSEWEKLIGDIQSIDDLKEWYEKVPLEEITQDKGAIEQDRENILDFLSAKDIEKDLEALKSQGEEVFDDRLRSKTITKKVRERLFEIV